MRTIDVGLQAPLLTASSVVSTGPKPWLHPWLELSLRTRYVQGVRLRFHSISAVDAFAAAVRKFVADSRSLLPDDDAYARPAPPPAARRPPIPPLRAHTPLLRLLIPTDTEGRRRTRLLRVTANVAGLIRLGAAGMVHEERRGCG